MLTLLEQVEKLEEIIDRLFSKSQEKLGSSDSLTKDSLQALVYLQGVKYDISQIEKTEVYNKGVKDATTAVTGENP